MHSEEEKKPTILIVDDSPSMIRLHAEFLRADYQVRVAGNGKTAFEIIDRLGAPDLILLDVIMPEMNGYEVCRRLRDDPVTREVPVIFVTAQNNPQEEAEGLKAGAVDFISKPANADVLLARVQNHLLLHQLKTNLEKKVEERTAELELALNRLRESQEQLTSSEAKATLSTLIASVSHELKTPLGIGVMAASALAEQTQEFARSFESGTLKRSDMAKMFTRMSEGTTLMLRNLERAQELLSQFQQVAADQASEQRRKFDLADVLNEIVATLSPSLKRYPYKVALDIPSGIQMDSQPGPLGQILINLINNAYLHAFENRTDGVLTIRAVSTDHHVHLSVSDNGVGMSAELLSKMFQPFFSTKIGKGGTGLGLAIVENLVKKTLGGDLQASSEVGKGTCFDIYLPRILPVHAT